jgi:hypothetical protein
MSSVAYQKKIAFNDLELKGYLHSLIERAKDRIQLLQFANAAEAIIEQNDLTDYTQEVEGWNDLTPQQQTTLALAIEESNDPKNLVPHEDVLKMMDKWLTE